MKGEGLNRFVQAQLSQDSSGMGALHTVCCSTGIELLLNACNSKDQREKEHHAANECWPAPGWSPRAAVILLPVCAGQEQCCPRLSRGLTSLPSASSKVQRRRQQSSTRGLWMSHVLLSASVASVGATLATRTLQSNARNS